MIEREPVMELLRKDLKKAEIAYKTARSKANVTDEELANTEENLSVRRFVLWTMDEFLMERDTDRGW